MPSRMSHEICALANDGSGSETSSSNVRTSLVPRLVEESWETETILDLLSGIGIHSELAWMGPLLASDLAEQR